MKQIRLAVAVLVAGATLAVAAVAAGAMTTRETSVFNGINSKRSGQGESTVASNTTLYNCAKSWAQHIASTRVLADDANLLNGTCGGSGWSELAGISAEGPAGFDVVSAWMNSCVHRDIILTAGLSHLGMAMATSSDGTEWWVGDFGNSTSVADGPITTVQNGCMEYGPFVDGVAWSSVRTLGQWNTYHDSGGAAYWRTTSVPQEGTHVVQITDPDPGTANATQVVKGAAGKSYTLTGWSYYGYGTAQYMYLDFLNSSYGRISVKTVAAPTTTGWHQLTTGAVTAPTGTAYVRVILYGLASSGNSSNYYWDTVELTRA